MLLAKIALPSNTDFDAVLLKVALLDRLYATSVYHLNPVADRVVRVFGASAQRSGRDTVIELAKPDPLEPHRLLSFASKYMHFFHDDTVPIVDSYAAFALSLHLRERRSRADQWAADYGQFCSKLDDLLRASAVPATAREFDHYLWLAGNWVTLHKAPGKAQIGKELSTFFSNKSNEECLVRVFGPLLSRAGPWSP